MPWSIFKQLGKGLWVKMEYTKFCLYALQKNKTGVTTEFKRVTTQPRHPRFEFSSERLFHAIPHCLLLFPVRSQLSVWKTSP